MRQASFLRSAACVLALGLPVFGFAAEKVIVSSLKGGAQQKGGETAHMLAVGNEIESGGFIEIAAGSSLGVKLPGGSTINFGPGSVFRIKTGGDSLEITLLSGSVAGNFAAPAPVIRTPVGTVSPEGASALISFQPGRPGTPGKLAVSAVSGTPVVMPTGATTGVGITAGQQMNLGGALIDPARVKLTPAEIEAVKNSIEGVVGEADQSGDSLSADAKVKLPNLSMLGAHRNRQVPPASPNGGGVPNL